MSPTLLYPEGGRFLAKSVPDYQSKEIRVGGFPFGPKAMVLAESRENRPGHNIRRPVPWDLSAEPSAEKVVATTGPKNPGPVTIVGDNGKIRVTVEWRPELPTRLPVRSTRLDQRVLA